MRAVRQLVLLTTAVAVLAAVPGRVQAEAIDFDRDIAPIFEERCWHCHGEDEAESGLRLDRRSRVLRGGDSGLAAVVPGQPEQSYLLDVVKHLDPEMKIKTTSVTQDTRSARLDRIGVSPKWVKSPMICFSGITAPTIL